MTSNKNKPVTGIILAGGRSTRMGKNKALLKLNSKTVIEQTLSRLQRVVNEIVVVTNTPAEYEYPGIRVVQDFVPYQGPLGGILTGLDTSTNFLNVVVACDMPFLNPKLLKFLISFSGDYDAVVPESRNGLEPLHAVYSKKCIQSVRKVVRLKKLRIINVLSDVKVKYIGADQLNEYDPEGLSFFNINSYEDFERAKQLLQEKSELW